MKKELMKRTLLGIPLGIALSHCITVMISLSINDGNFYPFALPLISEMGNSLNAIVLQTVTSGILGAIFGAASLIWQQEHWSLFKQTALYFFVCFLGMLPTAYVNYWMAHTLQGIFFYLLIYISIFVVIWIAQYIFWYRKIKHLNQQIHHH